MTVKHLETIGAQTLMETQFKPLTWLVDNLLPTSSTNLLASPPKFGKSIFCLNLGYCVSMGLPFLDRQTSRCQVLYLALEDTRRRLQTRLWELTGNDDASDDFRLETAAATIGSGLTEQIEAHLQQYPHTKLVIVDTLQVARDSNIADYSYSRDYDDLRMFKHISDQNDICILVVHHLRKTADADEFTMISGTTGITGAVDGMFVMRKDKRSSSLCLLSATGRDIEYQELLLEKKNFAFELQENLTEEDSLAVSVPECVQRVAYNVLSSEQNCRNTATNIIRELELDVTPAVLGKQLNRHREWLSDIGINFSAHRTMEGRYFLLELKSEEH